MVDKDVVVFQYDIQGFGKFMKAIIKKIGI